MGETLVDSEPFVRDERLRRCIARLAANGIKVTVDQELRIDAVFIAACIAGGGVPAGDRLASLIAPIVARSLDEQHTCRAIITAAFPSVDATHRPAPENTDAPIDESAAAVAASARAAAKRQARLRRIRSIGVSLIVLALLSYGLSWLLLARFRPHPPPANAPASHAAPPAHIPPFRTRALPPISPPEQRPQIAAPQRQTLRAWLADLQRRYPAIAPIVLTAVVLIIVLITGSSRRLLAAYARQARVVPRDEIRVLMDDAATRLQPDEPFIRHVQALRRRIETVTGELDVNRTVAATAARGGIFTPVHASRFITPEYLVLIDARGAQDHVAAYSESLTRALDEAGISATVYTFDRDARRVMLGSDQRAIDIRDLAARYSAHRLFVFSDGEGLIDAGSGRPHDWCRVFGDWEQRFLFTWRDPHDWAQLELTLERDLEFAVLPATRHGLIIAASSFERDARARFEAPSNAAGAPRLFNAFAVGAWRWLDQYPPPAADIADLIWQLRQELSAQAFSWLCSAAVYPEISWSLTVFLGTRVAASSRGDAAWLDTLLEIARLPWLHAGHMPVWLRERLIDELDADQRARIYDAIEGLFLTRTARASGASGLRLGHGARQASSTDAAERDRILIDFLAAGKTTSADFRLRNAILRAFGVADGNVQRDPFGRSSLVAARAAAEKLRTFVEAYPPERIQAEMRARAAFGIGVSDVRTWWSGGGPEELPTPLVLLDDTRDPHTARVVDERTLAIWTRRRRLSFTLGLGALLVLTAGFALSSDRFVPGAQHWLTVPVLYLPALLLWLGLVLPMQRAMARFPHVSDDVIDGLAGDDAPKDVSFVRRIAPFVALPIVIVTGVSGAGFALHAFQRTAPASAPHARRPVRAQPTPRRKPAKTAATSGAPVRAAALPATAPTTARDRFDQILESAEDAEKRGRYADAKSAYNAALQLARRRGDENLQAIALYDRGNSEVGLHDYAAADADYRESLSLARKLADLDLQASAFEAIASLMVHEGRESDARVAFQEALKLYRSLGDTGSIARIDRTLGSNATNASPRPTDPLRLLDAGTTASQRGNLTQALSFYQQALAVFAANGDELSQADVLIRIADVDTRLGRYDNALAAYREALPFSQKIANSALEPQILVQMAGVQRLLGQFSDSLQSLQEALVLYGHLGDVDGAARVKTLIAQANASLPARAVPAVGGTDAASPPAKTASGDGLAQAIKQDQDSSLPLGTAPTRADTLGASVVVITAGSSQVGGVVVQTTTTTSYVVTVADIDKESSITVFSPGNNRSYDARVVRGDNQADLALLIVDGVRLPVAQFSANDLPVTTAVMIAGPGAESTTQLFVNAGSVSASSGRALQLQGSLSGVKNGSAVFDRTTLTLAGIVSGTTDGSIIAIPSSAIQKFLAPGK